MDAAHLPEWNGLRISILETGKISPSWEASAEWMLTEKSECGYGSQAWSKAVLSAPVWSLPAPQQTP